MKQIVVCGLYRSGTNWLQSLIDLNYEVEPVQIPPVWGSQPYKHAIYNFEFKTHDLLTETVAIYKPIHTWLESIMRNCIDLADNYDVLWKNGHHEILCNASDETDTQHTYEICLSLEKLIKLYNDWFDKWENHPLLFNHSNIVLNTHKYTKYIECYFSLKKRYKEIIFPNSVYQSQEYDKKRIYTYNNITKEYDDVIFNTLTGKARDFNVGRSIKKDSFKIQESI